MSPITQPSKQQVRAYLQSRRDDPAPPPSPAEVRRALGWCLNSSYDPKGRDCPR